MATRPPDQTHERDYDQPPPPDAPQGAVESPSGDRMQGANGIPHAAQDTEATADQDIDTAGTDMDDESPTKSVGTGIDPSDERG